MRLIEIGVAAAISLIFPSIAIAADAGTSASANPHAANPHGEADPHGGHGGGGDPHGGHGGGGMPAPEIPQDSTDETPLIPTGAVDLELRNEKEEPMSGALVTLGIVHNTVAKGESREKVTRAVDANGHVRFEHLETGSAVAYRISTVREGGTFASSPFRLAEKGVKVILHTFPVTSDVERTLVVAQAIVYVELREDRIQVQQATTVFNFGVTAWVPQDLMLPLPNGYTALTAGQEMSDVTIEPVEGRGARLKGTFGPGRHDFEFKWQLPYAGDREATIDAPVPPHVAAARVMVPASQAMRVEAEGFPAMQARVDVQGQRVLISERQLAREQAPLKRIRVVLKDLPSPGPGRYVAVLVAAFGLALGIGILVSRVGASAEPQLKSRQQQILAELEDLERAYKAGDVGPKTYERERTALIDRLAEVLAESTPAEPAQKKS
jgi:hypothetical protein